jgi:hypothetical protein
VTANGDLHRHASATFVECAIDFVVGVVCRRLKQFVERGFKPEGRDPIRGEQEGEKRGRKQHGTSHAEA